MSRRAIYAVLAIVIVISLPLFSAEDLPYRFVAFGDMGCGCSDQAKVATRLVQWYQANRFRTVLMLGDNIYGSLFGTRGGSKNLFSERFDKYYSPLIRDGVRFFATLGNHDYETRDGADEIADKERFHILGPNGYYAFKSDATIDGKPLVLFISLNSVDLIEKDASDKIQIQWLSKTLAENNAIWKVVYFHHPLYAPSGEGHEPSLNLRRSLEDVFVAAGVQLVLTGHNHYYARMKTQRGITHFISGGGGRDLKAPIQNEYTIKVAELPHFMYFEVYPDKMTYRMIPAYGNFSDSGTIPVTSPGENPPATPAKP